MAALNLQAPAQRVHPLPHADDADAGAAQTGLALCRFQPGTIDGVPQQSWTRMQYVWSLDA